MAEDKLDMAEDKLDIGSVDVNAPKKVSATFAKAQASAPTGKRSKRWTKLKLVSQAAFVFRKSRAYKKEGDPKFNTSPFLKKRDEVRAMPEIREIVRKFWGIIEMLKEPNGTLKRESYIELNMKLQKAMVADWDEDEARQDAFVDWKRDAKAILARRGGSAQKATKLKGINCSMNFDDFYLSMFELADHWTDTVEPDHYKFFFDNVLDAVTLAAAGGELHFKPTEDIELSDQFVFPGGGSGSGSLSRSNSKSSMSRSPLSNSAGARRSPTGAGKSNSGHGSRPAPSLSRSSSRSSMSSARRESQLGEMKSPRTGRTYRSLGAGGRRPSSVLEPVVEINGVGQQGRRGRRRSTIFGNDREDLDAALAASDSAASEQSAEREAAFEAERVAERKARMEAEREAEREAEAAARLGMTQEEWQALSADERAKLIKELDGLAELSPRSRDAREAELRAQMDAQRQEAMAQREADAAARLGMSAEEWAALSPEQRKKLLDELEKVDLLSPSARAQHEQMLKARARAKYDNVQARREADVAARLGMSAEEWAALSAEERRALLAKLDELDQLSPRSRARREAELKARARALKNAMRAERQAQLSRAKPRQVGRTMGGGRVTGDASSSQLHDVDVQAMGLVDFSFDNIARASSAPGVAKGDSRDRKKRDLFPSPSSPATLHQQRYSSQPGSGSGSGSRRPRDRVYAPHKSARDPRISSY